MEERAVRSQLVERNGILPEVSCPRVSRTPTERSAKLDYGDEVEINRPKILRGTLRIFDIAPVAAWTNYYPIAEPQGVKHGSPKKGIMMSSAFR
jgi:hypothetical protein